MSVPSSSHWPMNSSRKPPRRCCFQVGAGQDRLQVGSPCQRAREANGTSITAAMLDGHPVCRHREPPEIEPYHLSCDRELYRSLELGPVVVASDRPEWSCPSFVLGV